MARPASRNARSMQKAESHVVRSSRHSEPGRFSPARALSSIREARPEADWGPLRKSCLSAVVPDPTVRGVAQPVPEITIDGFAGTSTLPA